MLLFSFQEENQFLRSTLLHINSFSNQCSRKFNVPDNAVVKGEYFFF